VVAPLTPPLPPSRPLCGGGGGVVVGSLRFLCTHALAIPLVGFSESEKERGSERRNAHTKKKTKKKTRPPRATPPPPPNSPKKLSPQELGVTILEDLARQRETILHARDTLHGADDGIARARKLLTTMSRRITTNRLVMGGIVATLLGAIILLIAVKLKRH
jgi:hypothetical protein